MDYPLTTFVLCGEEEAEKVFTFSCGQACGGRGCIEGLLVDEELEVSEEGKMVCSVGAAPAVPPWPEEEEEEINPGQVADRLLLAGAALVGGFKGLEDGDGDGADSRWWGVLFDVCGDLLAQLKV